MEHYENLPWVTTVRKWDFLQGELLRCQFFVCVGQVSDLGTLKSQGGGFQPWEKDWKGSSLGVLVPSGARGLSCLKEGATHDVHFQLCPLWVTVRVDLEPFGSLPWEGFVGQQHRELLKGDLASLGGTVQSNNHIFNNFLAASLHFCRAASASLTGLVAALGHHGDTVTHLQPWGCGAIWAMKGSWLLESPEH